ncbi:hypothetical protein DFJ63DRAFT_320522 [Scheffersomyces coipomensis]|uniref:uncharacterized protein n=1 Tax=Scheffersomyces coipomensis TaxID=1788519 RepID=UPI00315D732E
MSSISFNIVYGSITKKVTINKANTIQQLIHESFTSFKINHDKYQGKLIIANSNKTLDNSLPIRLSSLINNSKLILKVEKRDESSESLSNSGIEVNIKLAIAGGKSLIHKLNNQVTLFELLNQFDEKYKGDIVVKSDELKFKNIQLSILNLNYGYEQFNQQKLESIIGRNVNSVVIRLNYIQDEDDQKKRRLHEEQQEIIRLQLKQQSERNLKIKQQRELEEEQARAKQELEEKQKSKEEVVEPEEAVEPMEIDEPSTVTDSTANVSQPKTITKRKEQPVEEDQYIYEQPELKETSQLYVPDTTKSSNSNIPNYENPEEDYEMTVNQAMTYQKIIQNSAIRKPSKVIKKRPSKYLIRIKFPDGKLLQINYLTNIEEIKFGQLIKRIDTSLMGDYINHYNLKLSYPPFVKIDINFTTNNLKLIDMKEFESEQVSLIWEVSDNNIGSNGPYIDQSKINEIKQSSELPEVLLESHRKELPSDTSNKVHHKSGDGSSSNSHSNSNDNSNDTKSSSTGKTPKWFKFK